MLSLLEATQAALQLPCCRAIIGSGT